jgi:transcriptional/translational regulatory protein YebC/TACO1
MVQDALRLRGLAIEAAELTMKPKTLIGVDEKTTLAVMGLIENLEELDDVTSVYSNLDIPEELLAQMED